MNKLTFTYVLDSVLNLPHVLSYYILTANNESVLLEPFNPEELPTQQVYRDELASNPQAFSPLLLLLRNL